MIGYMVLLGAGIGLSMQTLVLATENVVPTRDLGTATSSVSFFRSMGGSIGVALFRALFVQWRPQHAARRYRRVFWRNLELHA